MRQMLSALLAALALTAGVSALGTCSVSDTRALGVPDGVSPPNGQPSLTSPPESAGCVCPSAKYFTGSSCDDNPVCGPLSQSDPTTFTSSGMALTTVTLDSSATNVQFNLTMPSPVSNRYFDNFYVLSTIAADNLPGCDLTAFSAIADAFPGTCEDTFVFVIPLSVMQTCGLSTSPVNDPSSGYQTYDAVIKVSYTDVITVGGDGFGGDTDRADNVSFPIRVNLQSSYTQNLTTSSVSVYANQQLDFGITSQVVGAASSVLKFLYRVQYPYAIRSWSPDVSVSGVVTGSVVGALTANSSICTSPEYYSASAVGDTATCTIIDNVLTLTPSGPFCSFTGQDFGVSFDVGCGNNIDSDCPLQATEPGYANFTIHSEAFCQDSATTSTINGVVTISAFTAVQTADKTTAQDAVRFGDTLTYRVLFTGLALETATVYNLETRLDSAGSFTQLGPASDYTSNLVFTGFDVTTTGFGLINDHELLFSLAVTQATVGQPSTYFVRGQAFALYLRLTVNVSYATVGRRRRRQTNVGSGLGTKVSDPVTIYSADTAEAAPTGNMAVRSAPVLALALALLSAILVA